MPELSNRLNSAHDVVFFFLSLLFFLLLLSLVRRILFSSLVLLDEEFSSIQSTSTNSTRSIPTSPFPLKELLLITETRRYATKLYLKFEHFNCYQWNIKRYLLGVVLPLTIESLCTQMRKGCLPSSWSTKFCVACTWFIWECLFLCFFLSFFFSSPRDRYKQKKRRRRMERELEG